MALDLTAMSQEALEPPRYKLRPAFPEHYGLASAGNAGMWGTDRRRQFFLMLTYAT